MPQRPNLASAIDVCGTGGSGLPRINTSTISAFILAKLGVKVAKHGNKAASGRFGSFDLLESLGINFTNNISDIEKNYKKENLAFLFAPFFHPVMKNFAELRKKIGKPTFFNLLGPLLNPASPKRQIIGTTFKDKMRIIAETCRLLGKEKIYIVCGEDGLDEVTLTGRTFVTELANDKIKSYTITPEDFGICKASFSEIQGGDSNFNTKIALNILNGKCKTRHKDLVLVNSALALKLADKVKTLKEGYKMASRGLSAPSILLKIIEQKKREVATKKRKYPLGEIPASDRDFISALKNGNALIAEIKKASPSAGMICKKGFSAADLAAYYERSGADAISVLCDKKFFRGDLKYLKEARESTYKTPLLCKDFIIDEYQIYEARKYGADAILLIAAILTERQITKFIKIAENLKMAVLCEVHTLEELRKVLKTPAKIIGINNRDLHTFKIHLSVTKKIAKHIPSDKIIVSESGFSSRADLSALPRNIDAILVGTALIRGIPLPEFIRKKLKICGIKNPAEAKFCEDLGVNFIGLNFVPTSKRRVSLGNAKKICEAVKKIKKVGIFQNQPLSEVNNIAKILNLDYIQLSGNEDLEFVKKCSRSVIKGLNIREAEKYFPHTAYILFDGPVPGSGTPFNFELKNFKYPFFIAGGISPSNIVEIVKKINPLGIDIASGVETSGKIDFKKIKLIFNKLKSC